VCGQILADVVSPNRKLSVATVDQYCEPNKTGSTDRRERIKSSPHRPSAVENIVNKDDDPVIYAAAGHFRRRWSPVSAGGEIIAVHRHIEGSCGYRNAGYVGDVGSKPMREYDPSGRNTQEDEIRSLWRSLNDFVSDTPKSSVDI
jgi:hypothetical protein